MSRQHPEEQEHIPNTNGSESEPAPTTRPNEFMVQTKRVIESWDMPKMKTGRKLEDGSEEIVIVPKSNPIKTTKLVNGLFGPFLNRPYAEQVSASMCQMESVISAEVITVVDGPEAAPADKQVPASEDVLRQMIADGKVPGVPADAAVRVAAPEAEGEPQAAPSNLVAFPGTEEPAPVKDEE